MEHGAGRARRRRRGTPALVSRRLRLVLAVALVVRLLPILASDRIVADVLR